MLIHFPIKVAVVDDEKDLLKIIRMVLAEVEEIELYCFSDPLLALEEIKKRNFYMVIADINMPKMMGDDLLREIRELKKGVEVILMTGDSAGMVVPNCFRLGARDFLFKPFTHDELIKKVRNCLEYFKTWNDITAKMINRGSE